MHYGFQGQPSFGPRYQFVRLPMGIVPPLRAFDSRYFPNASPTNYTDNNQPPSVPRGQYSSYFLTNAINTPQGLANPNLHSVIALGEQFKIRPLGLSQQGMSFILGKEGWEGQTTRGANGERLTRPTYDRLARGVLTVGPGLTHGLQNRWYTDAELHAMKLVEMTKVINEVARAELYIKARMAQKGGLTPEQAANPDFHIWGQATNDKLVSFAYNLGCSGMDIFIKGGNPGKQGLAGLLYTTPDLVTSNGKFNVEGFTQNMTLYCKASGSPINGLRTRRLAEARDVYADASAGPRITSGAPAPSAPA